MYKKIIIAVSFLCFSIILIACKPKDSETYLRVGVVASPMADIVELVVPLLKEQGIDLEIVRFSDYIQVNHALNEGAIDANFSQHYPYMENFNIDHGTDLVSIQPVYIAPIVGYSHHYTHINQLQNGDLVAIARDPINLGRALALLDAIGLITLVEGTGFNGTLTSIENNPLNLRFELVDLNSLAPMYPDADLVLMYPSFGMPIGLTPENDAIIIEDTTDSMFAITVATRADFVALNKIVQFRIAMSSEAVRQFILENYGSLYDIAF